MKEDLNILVLSCGTRNKIIQYFKQELSGEGLVLATDCSELAPALYEADKYFVVPRMDEEGYLDVILSICNENNVKAVISLIDPELSLLAKNREEFIKIGTVPIVSENNLVEMCFDKYKMYNFLNENEIPTVTSYIDKKEFYDELEKGEIDYPVFVKPVKGSASINVSIVYSNEEIELLFNRFDNLIIQEFMDGKEYGADVYVDLISSKPVEIFVKEKIKMRAGETDKSISVKDDKIFEFVQTFLQKVDFSGIIDIDIFEIDGKLYLSEVNPRFGGGYPHAYESGVNVPKMIINNIKGIVNNNLIGNYKEGTKMLKYNEVRII